jgi:hypothetical protein
MRPDGPHRYYALRSAPFTEIEGWLSQFRRLWEKRLDRFGAALERRRKKGRSE